ncbi:DUF6702 family protein [Duganella phyllosphaerae]|uniref:Uncharacterized protein n=1 Tax=Duganella phyllosphaerae TaxID=762836 RepID=A0A1E7WVU5_9BURK|nr:DUF6702 family protein [Duganella phyllosphaerae]OFA03895.1 hypothetical protein DUPY_17100 [Duganella phyllosphaerae]
MLRSVIRCAAAVLAFSSAAASAHNYHMGIADISYNERTGSTEIVHTYTAHDVATLLTRQAGRVVDLGQPGSEALLRKYAEQQFTVSGRKGERLPLTWIGMKADADSVVIFQEIARTRLAAGSRIHNAVLTDLIPTQKNTVNVQVDGPVKTLIFDQGNLDQLIP